MAQSGVLRSNGVNSREWQNALPRRALPQEEPPPWLVPSVAEFLRIKHILEVVRPIRAISFGGALVFIAVLALLFRHSPDGQTTLLVVSLFGLPLCLATWLVASSAQRRLSRAKNHIEERVYGAGLYLDDEGRALTDNPHPVLILDPATGGRQTRRDPRDRKRLSDARYRG
jgi:hypothetical protein